MKTDTQAQDEQLVVGLMSGTSLDGIDAALLRITAKGSAVSFVQGLYRPFTGAFRQELQALITGDGLDRKRVVRMNILMGHLLADAVEELLRQSDVCAESISVIGSHGLTIGHYPEPDTRFGHRVAGSWQIGDGDVIAERLGIPVVSDFRIRDMAAGGEGAPLVPLLDRQLFQHEKENRACLNIGGIANLTILPGGRPADILAFDTGPGNCLLDEAVARLIDPACTHDPDGQYADAGTVNEPLLDRLMGDPYFDRLPPKSTGREYFSPDYLAHILEIGRDLPFGDLLSTVAALTPASIVRSLECLVSASDFPCRLIVSGGGVHNRFFMRKLAELLPDVSVVSSATEGVDPDFKEALAFGWFGYRTVNGLASSVPAVTGCDHAVILGKISPAGVPRD